MKKLLKRILYNIILRSWSEKGLLKLFKNKTAVIMYHGIVEDKSKYNAWTMVRASEFKKQLSYIKSNFKLISIDDALREDKNDGKPKAVITFDDGYENCLKVALPIIEEFEVPAIIYVSTEAVQTQNQFWWDDVIVAVQSLQKSAEINLEPFGQGKFFVDIKSEKEQLWTAIQSLLEALKKINPEKRANAVSDILGQLQCDQSIKANGTFNILTVEQVQTLSQSEHITIGSHSHCHNILTQKKPVEVEKSISLSLNLLNEWIEQPICHFSFPNGSYNQSILDILKKLGIHSGVTTKRGRWSPKDAPYVIPRIGIGGYDPIEDFKVKLLRPF